MKLRQPVAGKPLPIEDVPDRVIAEKMLGPGAAIEPTSGIVVAPADATVSAVARTGHALALLLDSGEEILIHIGVDTVKMKGEGFTPLVKAGARVRAAAPLLVFDIAKIQAAGHPVTTSVIVTNDPEARVEFV